MSKPRISKRKQVTVRLTQTRRTIMLQRTRSRRQTKMSTQRKKRQVTRRQTTRKRMAKRMPRVRTSPATVRPRVTKMRRLRERPVRSRQRRSPIEEMTTRIRMRRPSLKTTMQRHRQQTIRNMTRAKQMSPPNQPTRKTAAARRQSRTRASRVEATTIRLQVPPRPSRVFLTSWEGLPSQLLPLWVYWLPRRPRSGDVKWRKALSSLTFKRLTRRCTQRRSCERDFPLHSNNEFGVVGVGRGPRLYIRAPTPTPVVSQADLSTMPVCSVCR
mmetsp:Transcript_22142/g.48427  ORF Transcript_22142/g.48427 Transcript_22142/m.48427 type:complete len:271 (-) Transcript_22142:485-1297(-)